MRILYIHDYPFRTKDFKKPFFEVGMPAEYFQRFTSNGFDVDVLSRLRISPAAEPSRESLKVNLSGFGGDSYLRIFRNLAGRRFKPGMYDLVVVNYPSILGIFWIIFFLKSRPYVIEHVNDDAAFRSKKFGFLIGFILNVLKRRAFSNAVGVTVVSDYLINEHYPPRYLIASNVNVRVEQFISRRISSPLRLISIGAVSRKKGIDLVLEQLSDVRFPVHYTIVGEQTDVKLEYDDFQLNDHVSVHLTGILPRENVDRLLKSSHIMIHGSRSEGLPRAVIEAMSWSLPVISSELPCFDGLIDQSLRIDFSKKLQLRDTLLLLRSDLDFYRKISRENYERALGYDHRILGQRLANFYREVADELHSD